MCWLYRVRFFSQSVNHFSTGNLAPNISTPSSGGHCVYLLVGQAFRRSIFDDTLSFTIGTVTQNISDLDVKTGVWEHRFSGTEIHIFSHPYTTRDLPKSWLGNLNFDYRFIREINVLAMITSKCNYIISQSFEFVEKSYIFVLKILKMTVSRVVFQFLVLT